MIKVLELGITDTIGGIETYLFTQYQYFEKTLIHCDYINDKNYTALAFEKEFLKMGAGIVCINANFSHHPLRFMKEFKKFLKTNKYDVIIANATLYSLKQGCEMIIAKQVGVPVRIFHSHIAGGKRNIKTLLGWMVERPFCAYDMGHVLTNRWACSEIAGLYFFRKWRFDIIHNSIDTQKFRFSKEVRDEVRERFLVPNDTIILGNVGRIHYPKNQSFLVSVLYALLKKGVKAELWLVGAANSEDEELRKVKDAVQRYGLQDKVHLFGQRTDVNELFMAMDVFLLPSLFEGFPIVGLEAECSGLPCIFHDTVTHNIALTPNTMFVNRRKGVDGWLHCIEEVSHISFIRETGFLLVEKAGYSNSENARHVQNLLSGYFR